MRLKYLFIIIFSLSFVCGAVEVSDLYETTIEIENKTRKARVQASKRALDKVIQKLTGKYTSQSTPLIEQAKKSISNYMLKFEYLESESVGLKLKVKFEAEKVEKLIIDSKLPLWGNRRPLIVVWLAIEDNLRRELVTQDSYPQLGRLIYDTASEWGVPVVIPLLDLTDRATVGLADVWGNFSDPVEIASERYSAEKIITARMFKRPNSSSWQLEWRYTNAEQFESNQLIGDKQAVLIQMVNQFSEELAGLYAIDPSKSYEIKKTIVTIDKLKNFQSIELAKRQIATLSTVVSVNVIYRSNDTVRYQVSHTSTIEDLTKSMKLEQDFKVYSNPRDFYHISNSQVLKYSWYGQ
jgi:uncharacterized protein